VDLEAFQPLNKPMARQVVGLRQRAPLIFYAGRIEPFKGLDLLVQAAAMLDERDDLTVLIAGGDYKDPEVRRLFEMAGSLGLEKAIRFLGTIPHEQIPLYYAAADICVVPSYHESFGLAALEAMACATPVVATNVGGLQSLVVDGETGYLVGSHCPAPFSDSLDVLLLNRPLRDAMGKAARARAEEFSWFSVAAQMHTLYRETISSTPFAGGVYD
jgi:D-inositol-3-phosphate glycosyltransferase